MISRTWRGTTRAEHADAYLRYMHDTGLVSLRSTPGNLAVTCLRRVTDDRAEFLVWSLWESEEAVRAFAGDNPSDAVYYPQDEAYLIEREDRVEHFEIVFHEGRVPDLPVAGAAPA